MIAFYLKGSDAWECGRSHYSWDMKQCDLNSVTNWPSQPATRKPGEISHQLPEYISDSEAIEENLALDKTGLQASAVPSASISDRKGRVGIKNAQD